MGQPLLAYADAYEEKFLYFWPNSFTDTLRLTP